MASTALPGAPERQRLLRGIAMHYGDDPRVRAVAVFGSLARGTWDEHSDLDVAVVTADGVTVDVFDEVGRLPGARRGARRISPLGSGPCRARNWRPRR